MINGGADLAWINVYDSYSWLARNKAVRFGSSDENAFVYDGIDTFLSVFDTATTLTYVPNEIWSGFVS